jgi:hypothetical protein
VNVDTISGETADIKPTIQYHTERILAALPTPKFMVGFADAVNRDISQEQYNAYKTQVRKARRELERDFRPALKRKAEEWGYDNASVELQIERQTHENPLRNNDFNAQEFKALAEGMRSLEQSDTVSTKEIRENFLGLPPEKEGEDNTPDDDESQEDNDSEQTVDTEEIE